MNMGRALSKGAWGFIELSHDGEPWSTLVHPCDVKGVVIAWYEDWREAAAAYGYVCQHHAQSVASTCYFSLETGFKVNVALGSYLSAQHAPAWRVEDDQMNQAIAASLLKLLNEVRDDERDEEANNSFSAN